MFKETELGLFKCQVCATRMDQASPASAMTAEESTSVFLSSNRPKETGVQGGKGLLEFFRRPTKRIKAPVKSLTLLIEGNCFPQKFVAPGGME